MTHSLVDRRALMRGGLTAAAGAAIAAPTGVALLAPDTAAAAAPIEKRLAFRNVHTGERVDARWFGASGFDSQGLAEIDHGLRDWRTGEVIRMDRGLIGLLARLRDDLDVSPRTPFDLISGYRSPHTNAALHERSGAVASTSQHMLGKATDIAVPGVKLERLHAAALAARRGGVGFYPTDDFVHIDTGRLRHW